jgi:16S rRNA (guanine527-N7)-methyltransferase
VKRGILEYEFMQPEKRIWFRTHCIKNSLVPTDAQLEQLDRYVDLLLEWNGKINLISRKDQENIWSYHILHSISPLFKIEIPQSSTLVDIGTGGGLPGLPVKIMRPDLNVLCLDSTGKKAEAVSQMISDLKLERIEAVWGRAEEIGRQPELFEKFDFVIARAVAPLIDLVSWSKTFLKKSKQKKSQATPGPHNRIDSKPPALLAFKGGDLLNEINIAKRKHPHINVDQIDLAFDGSEQLITSDKKILLVHF